jgi:hypothetical protein
MAWNADEAALAATVDLNIGEERTVELPDGSTATVRLRGIEESRDDVRGAVRSAVVKLLLDGVPASIVSATYHLPVRAGSVQVDCPITRGYLEGSHANPWGLESDARLRLWPAGSPWIAPATFSYPIRQRWFASDTQMANEPTFVDGPELPTDRRIYYHDGLDFGGCEGMVVTVAACDALVVSAGKERLPGHEDSPARTRADVVYLMDRRGWYHRHSHLQSIDPALKVGATVLKGQTVGMLGKEGASGGWSHLHYDLTRRQPSGKWGSEEAYAYAWQAYVAGRSPGLIAVARPHHLIWSGQAAVLDASRSWSADGLKLRCEWTFTDGRRAEGVTVRLTYPRPGVYSEIVKVTDSRGRTAYDFAVVQVVGREKPEQVVPGIHAACAPTFGLRPGGAVTFKVRSFGTTHGEEVWDFGDGSKPVAVKSDGNVDHWAKDGYAVTEHAFKARGDYIVTVRRTDEHGVEAIAHLHVAVEA